VLVVTCRASITSQTRRFFTGRQGLPRPERSHLRRQIPCPSWSLPQFDRHPDLLCSSTPAARVTGAFAHSENACLPGVERGGHNRRKRMLSVLAGAMRILVEPHRRDLIGTTARDLNSTSMVCNGNLPCRGNSQRMWRDCLPWASIGAADPALARLTWRPPPP